MIPATYNPQYKTTPCRHWQATGTCQIGVRCHFAHGNVPPGTTGFTDPKTTYLGGGLGTGTTNYKAIKCRYFELGLCRYGESCHFGHSDSDIALAQQQQMLLQNSLVDPNIQALQLEQLKQQYYLQQQQLLIQQQQQQLQMNSTNTGSTNSSTSVTTGNSTQSSTESAPSTPAPPTSAPSSTYSIENDPNVQKYITLKQLQFIIGKVTAIPTNTNDTQNKLKIADELLKAQNIQSCSLILNDIINKPDIKDDERKLYEGIINQASQLPIQIMTAYKVQLAQLQQQQQLLLSQQQNNSSSGTGTGGQTE